MVNFFLLERVPATTDPERKIHLREPLFRRVHLQQGKTN